MEILTIKRIQVNPMKATEAKCNGYNIGNNTLQTQGFEIIYEDGYKSWCPCSIIEHNGIPSSDKYFIPESSPNMPEYLERMFEEFYDLRYRFVKIREFIKTNEYKQLDLCRQNYLKLQYTFMEGYLSVLAHRIYDEMKLNGFEVNME